VGHSTPRLGGGAKPRRRQWTHRLRPRFGRWPRAWAPGNSHKDLGLGLRLGGAVARRGHGLGDATARA
jgi:hypothetical protein